jgi:hypothetical protein
MDCDEMERQWNRHVVAAIAKIRAVLSDACAQSSECYLIGLPCRGTMDSINRLSIVK